jgi:MFS family permease
MKRHYAWTVAAVTFVVMIVSAGVRSVPGVLMVPLEREFGWSRAAVSFAVSINIFLYGMLGPFAAAVMNRLGVKRVMLASLALSGAGVALATRMRTELQLDLIWGVVVGTGTGLTAGVLGATVVQRWFHARRGLVMGVLTASSATGQMVFLPAIAKLAETGGWRWANYTVVAAVLLVIPLVAWKMADQPADKGLAPFGLPAGVPVPALPRANPIAQAFAALGDGVRHPDFWLLAASFFVCGASTNGLVGTHLIPACVDHGIPEVQAASLLALMGIFDLFGTTGSGWLTDRFDARKLLFCYYGLRGLSLVFLPHAFAPDSPGLVVFGIFYGLDWIATVPPTLALTAKSFGPQRAPLIFGWIMAAHQVGAALATFGAGWIRTLDGAYDRAFYAAGALCVVTACGVLGIARRRDPAIAAQASA